MTKDQKKKLKLNRAITFKISEEDDSFLDASIKKIINTFGFYISKSSFIRHCIFKSYVVIHGESGFRKTDETNINTSLKDVITPTLIKAYNIKNIVEIRKIKEKKDKGKYKIMKIRISEAESHFLEKNLFAAKRLTDINNLSIGEFLRFCINAEKIHAVMLKEQA